MRVWIVAAVRGVGFAALAKRYDITYRHCPSDTRYAKAATPMATPAMASNASARRGRLHHIRHAVESRHLRSRRRTSSRPARKPGTASRHAVQFRWAARAWWASRCVVWRIGYRGLVVCVSGVGWMLCYNVSRCWLGVML